MPFFRMKPVVVEAVQYTGDLAALRKVFPDAQIQPSRYVGPHHVLEVWNELESCWVRCQVNHWVIKGVKGEFYPCDPVVFTDTYDVMVG